MSDMNQQKLRFKEFDYEAIQKQLPEGYTAIPHLPIEMKIRRTAQIIVYGFSSLEDARKFVWQYQPFFSTYKFRIIKGMKSVLEYEYQVVAPHEMVGVINQVESLNWRMAAEHTVYKNSEDPKALYRDLGQPGFVKALIKKGELLLSTFKQCRTLENEARRDRYELRNIVEIIENNKKMEVDIGFDDSLLVLCTTFSSPDEAKDSSALIRVTDVNSFHKEVTCALNKMGLLVSEVLHGYCMYNDKVISIETDNFVTDFCKEMDSTGLFLGEKLGQFIKDTAENDIIMNKPEEFLHEKEYRFVWKLATSFEKENLKIYNLDLAKYCEAVEEQ
ncbi:hypothetical protein [Anaerotignum sp.]|nr:hypothetical protein [Anaerotignum sp.]MBQ7759463.1 hypothetical protein [Anaerotignum sp.]